MARSKKKKRSKLTPEQKEFRKNQRQFRASIRYVFKTAGFKIIPTRDKLIQIKGRDGEFDCIAVFDNIVLIVEDTCSASSDKIHAHLLKKNQFYEYLQQHQREFFDLLKAEFPEFAESLKAEIGISDLRLVIVYCSRSRLEDRHKERFPNIYFIENRHLRYFRALAATLGRSLRFELFKFFRLRARDIGVSHGTQSRRYEGFVLPESPSGYPPGFRVATFYVDPETLISVSYVLRKDGWRDAESLYQRMIGHKKIKSMRRYLAQAGRVFINNVIVSLPASTKLLNRDNDQLDRAKIEKTTSVNVEIEIEFNSVGLIDGQHRVFAYHEGTDKFDAEIAPKRKKQQLLVTGVIYPSTWDETAQQKFEAALFLEINDKQTRTKAELRQAIETIVDPYSTIAIARAVINRLAAVSPMCGIFEEDQFDTGKLKTSSIVSYGLRHIVKVDTDTRTLFTLWKHPDKETVRAAMLARSEQEKIAAEPPAGALTDYVAFCAREVNRMLIAYRKTTPDNLWTPNQKISRALTTTAINGLIFCLRRLIEEDRTATNPEDYEKGLKKLDVSFEKGRFTYKSSHWRALGEYIAKKCFLNPS
jgi:DGQHR domain-containing protein